MRGFTDSEVISRLWPLAGPAGATPHPTSLRSATFSRKGRRDAGVGLAPRRLKQATPPGLFSLGGAGRANPVLRLNGRTRELTSSL